MQKNLLLLALPLLFSACQKDSEGPQDEIPHNSTTVAMAFHWFWDTEAFHPDSIYTDDAGHAIEIDSLRFYLSRVWFENEAGDSIAGFPDRYHLIRSAEGAMIRTVGQLEAHMHTMHFTLGLDSAANYSDLSTAEYPLNVGNLYWAWNGRVFGNLVGRSDTDGDGSVVADGIISYDCGTPAAARNVELIVHTDADMGGTVIIDLDIDLRTVLQGIDVVASPITHTLDDPGLAMQVMDNLAVSISVP